MNRIKLPYEVRRLSFFVKDNFLLYSVLTFQSELETYKNMEVNKCAMVYSDLFYHSTHSVK